MRGNLVEPCRKLEPRVSSPEEPVEYFPASKCFALTRRFIRSRDSRIARWSTSLACNNEELHLLLPLTSPPPFRFTFLALTTTTSVAEADVEADTTNAIRREARHEVEPESLLVAPVPSHSLSVSIFASSTSISESPQSLGRGPKGGQIGREGVEVEEIEGARFK